MGVMAIEVTIWAEIASEGRETEAGRRNHTDTTGVGTVNEEEIEAGKVTEGREI